MATFALEKQGLFARRCRGRDLSENAKKLNLPRSRGIRVSVFGISPVSKENLGLRPLKNGARMEIFAVYKENHTLGPKCC